MKQGGHGQTPTQKEKSHQNHTCESSLFLYPVQHPNSKVMESLTDVLV